MKKYPLLIVLFSLFFIANSHSQSMREVLPATPSSAGLEKQVQSSVSFNTGTPNISLPIYNINYKDLNLPISLNYRASGIKVNDVASWVGLGWNLNAGGAIVRELRGIPDDTYSINAPNGVHNNAGYLYDSDFSSTLSEKNPNDYTINEQQQIAFGTKDQSPDIFHFNFGGYSGSFVFGADGNVRMLSENDIKVEIIKTTESIAPFEPFVSQYIHGAILEFKLITPDGVQYIFDQPEATFSGIVHNNGLTSNDCSPNFNDPYGANEIQIASFASWQLSKIISPNSSSVAEINLEYETEYLLQHNIMKQFHKLYSGNDDDEGYLSGGQVYFDDPDKNPETSTLKAFQIKKRLAGITWQYGAIEFIAEENRNDLYFPFVDPSISTPSKAKALSYIKIKNINGEVIKTFDFDYSYFSKTELNCSSLPEWVEAHRERLRLDSVKEYAGGSSLPPYVFNYNNTPLPPRHSVQKDFWGFYNGNMANNLLPTLYAYPSDDQTYYKNMYSIYPRESYEGAEIILTGADRSPNEALMQAGVLTKVTYPTGGNTSYEYESHRFTFNTEKFNYGNKEYLGGGLRVKRTISHDGISQVNDVIKNFVYKKNEGKSSGKLISMPEFATVSRLGQSSPYTPGNTLEEYTKWHSGYYSTTGSPVMYDYVEVDCNGNGKTTYNYSIPTSYSDGIFDSDWNEENQEYLYSQPILETNTEQYSHPYPYAYSVFPYTDLPNNNWNKGQLTQVSNYNESGSLVHNETYIYEIHRYEKIPAIKAHVSCYGCIESYTIVGKTYHTSVFQYLKRKIVTLDGVSTITDYTVGENHTAPIAETMTNSDGKIYKTEIDYPHEQGYMFMVDKNIINTPIEIRKKVDGNVTSGLKTVYVNETIIYPKQVIELLDDPGSNSANELLRSTLSFHQSGDLAGLPISTSQNFFPISKQFHYYSGTKSGLIKTTGYGQFVQTHDYYETGIKSRLLKEVLDENGIASTFDYDLFQRMTSSTARNGTISEGNAYYLGLVDGGRNYIVSTNSVDGSTVYNYFDGLGRSTVSVSEGYSPTHGDIATAQVYDNAGRSFQSYLPYRALTGGAYSAPYGAYETILYDNSPLNRVVGNIFADGSAVGVGFGTNGADEVENHELGTYYDQGELSRKDISDENGHITSVFTDKVGRLILTRRYLDGENIDTYNIYDDRGNLLRVLPPEGTEYIYTYDNRNRLVTKTIPGAGTTTFTYNNRDEVESTLDANGNSSIFTYDDYGRLLTQFTNGTQVAINTYDTAPGASLGQIATSETEVLDGSGTKLLTSFTYDDLGRVEGGNAANHIGGSDAIMNVFDGGTDRVLKIIRQHSGYENMTNIEEFNFDHRKRMTEAWFQTGAALNTKIADFKYDYKDRMIEKNLGFDIPTGNYLQSVDYTYNIRNWLTHINNVNPYGDNLAIESCENLPEQPISECGDVVLDLEEVLRIRFSEEEININCYDECLNYPVPAPPNGGSNLFRNAVNDQISAVINNKQLAEVSYPTKLSRVQFTDGRIALMLPDELGLFHGDYVKDECIDITGSNQDIGIITNKGPASVKFSELIEIRKNDTPVFEQPNECGEDLCPYKSDFYAKSVYPNIGDSYFIGGSAGFSNIGTLHNSLEDDGLIGSTSGGEFQWDIKLDQALPTGVELTKYEVTLKALSYAGKVLYIGLHDGNNLIPINGGQAYLDWSKSIISEQDLTLTPDDLISFSQMANMNLVVRVGGSFDLDGVSVDWEYKAACEPDPPIEPCITPIPDCTEAEQLQQSQSLKLISNAAESMVPGDLILPTLLYRIKLCNGDEVYLFHQELANLSGGYIILHSISVTGTEQTFDVDLGLGQGVDKYDLFSMRLYYKENADDQGNILNGPEQMNGNIANMQWQTKGRANQNYAFYYDGLDRLNTAKNIEYLPNGTVSTEDKYGVHNITYDLRGNIQSLNRNGLMESCGEPNGPNFGLIDGLDYTYSGDQLLTVTDSGSDQKGFKTLSGAGNYQYDANGNMTRDPNKGVTVEYNFLNLPKLITFDSGGSLTIIYDATGNKLRKINSKGAITDYIGGIEYKNETLKSVYHSEGRVTPSIQSPGEMVFEYAIKDHLGNSRVMFSDLDKDGKLVIGGENSEILQETHYYPFGMDMEGNWVPQVGDKNSYLYNGKELNEDFGLDWLDYGARWYDPAIGRWNAVDPLAEFYDNWSPYNYTLNNPIRYIDPDGRVVGRAGPFDPHGLLGGPGLYDNIVDQDESAGRLGEFDENENPKRSNESVELPAGFPRSAFNFQNISSNSQAAAIRDIPVNVYESEGNPLFPKKHKLNIVKIAFEVTLPKRLSAIHGGGQITKQYAAAKSAWAADEAMNWLAMKMSMDPNFAKQAFQAGGKNFIQRELAKEMVTYFLVEHEVNDVKYPAIPGARVQGGISGRVKPTTVGAGDILLEYVRNIFGY